MIVLRRHTEEHEKEKKLNEPKLDEFWFDYQKEMKEWE